MKTNRKQSMAEVSMLEEITFIQPIGNLKDIIGIDTSQKQDFSAVFDLSEILSTRREL